MSSQAIFKKGDLVTFICNWDNKGTVTLYQLVVYSAGKKQMILTDERGVKFQGRNFLPTREQYGQSVVVHRSEYTDEMAIALAKAIIAYRRNECEVAIARAMLRRGEEAYIKARQRDLAELHDPIILTEAEADAIIEARNAEWKRTGRWS